MRQRDLFQDPFHFGNEDAVIGDWDTGALHLTNAGEQIGAIEHTAAAMNDEIIAMQRFGKIHTADHIDLQTFNIFLS